MKTYKYTGLQEQYVEIDIVAENREDIERLIVDEELNLNDLIDRGFTVKVSVMENLPDLYKLQLLEEN
jgi:hypothetical protein